jgi:hypothetical protein
MRRAFRFALACLTLSAAAHAQVARPLPAQVPPPAPGAGAAAPKRAVEYTGPTAFQKAVGSQLVVSGTVTMTKETVALSAWQGAPAKTTYRVATIKVTDTLVGDKADTVSVLIAPADPDYVNDPFPGQPPQPYFPRMPNSIQLIDGQEGVFFLTRLPAKTDAYTPAGGMPPLNPLDTKYKEELAEVKEVAAVYADPVKALKAEKADARMKAASVLVSRYRRPPAYDGKQYEQKAIPAEESKLILQALADADWELWDKPQQPNEVRDYTLNPGNLLAQLQVHTGAPGKGNFPQVKQQPGQGYNAAYKAAFDSWMAGNGKDFEVKRYVQPGEKKEEKK